MGSEALLGIFIPIVLGIVWALIKMYFTVQQLKKDQKEDKEQINHLFDTIEIMSSTNNQKFNEISISLTEIKTMLKILMEERKVNSYGKS